MAIIRWDPFSELSSLHEQVNSLFNDTLGSDSTRTRSVMAPTMDVYSDDKRLTIEAQLPNFKEEEISIEQDDGELEIKAEHTEREESKDKKYLLRESVNRYYRRFALPRNADTEKIKADYKNGVLKIEIPFKQSPHPKRITLNTKNK